MVNSPVLARAVRGPILLIVLGILFALQQAYIVPFSKSFPVFLIVVGVLKLWERSAERPPVFPPDARMS